MFYCGMYVPLGDDKHRFVRDSSFCTLEIQDNIRDNFFSDKIVFPTKNYFMEFCLGLNFVSDYIPQLYFICNHLIGYSVRSRISQWWGGGGGIANPIWGAMSDMGAFW